MNQSNSTSDLPQQASTSPAPGSTAASVSPSAAQPATVNVLSPTARQRLGNLFEARAAMLPISVSYAQPQRPADPWQIFELRKNGNTYTLAPTVPDATLVPRADGLFLYVVRADDPGRIYVGVPYGRVGIDDQRIAIQGHTSLTGRTDVLYAGEFILEQGRLKSWGNASGHYQPPAALRNTNLLPVIQTMLPEASFVNYWGQDNTARQAELGQLRGYMNMMDSQASPGAGATASGSSDRLRLRVGNSEMTLQHAQDLGAMIDGLPLQDALRQSTATALLQNSLADRLSFDGDMLQGQVQVQHMTGIEDMVFELGQLSVPIKELRNMGARVDGRVLMTVLLQDGQAAVQSNLDNRLQFESNYLLGERGVDRTPRNVEILMEVAATRTNQASLVIAPAGTTLVDAMNHQLGRVRSAVEKALRSAKSNMLIYLMPDGSVVRQSGTSLQVFGVYNSVRGLSEAIARGDTGTAAIHVAGMGSEAASLATENLIPALGRRLQAGNIARFNAFAASGLGRRLGGPARLGSNVGRSGGLVGAGISVPFDIYNAVTSFQSAAASDGDTAQDHYVNGGLATVSAVVTISLAAAAFAGVAAAGPLGLIIGIGLAVGGGIYHSVRYVDELDQYARLTAGERFVTGLASFVGMSASQDIEDRAAVARARDIYYSAKRSGLKAILEEKGWRVAIFGEALITPQAPVEQWSNSFITDLHEDGTELVQQPAKVIDNASDDTIDARVDMQHIPNQVLHSESSSDTILWAVGDGNDWLVGAADRSNVFTLNRGRKVVRGGDRDDIVMLNAAPGTGSAFDGGDGVDTLVLAGDHAAAGKPHPTVRVQLDRNGDSWEWDSSPDIDTDANGGQQRRQQAGNRVDIGTGAGGLKWDGELGALHAIENVITPANATTTVTGNDLDNVFVLNGDGDSAGGMGGNDTYIVNGGGRVALVAGRGENRFRISRGIDTVGVWSRSTSDHMMLEFDRDEIEVKAVDNSLSIALGEGEERKHVWFHGLFAYADDGTQQAVREDGKLRLWTRDGFALAPILSSVGRSEDGLIDLAAAAADAPETGAMDLLIQYAASWGAGATGSAGHDSLATAATGTQAMLLSAPMA